MKTYSRNHRRSLGFTLTEVVVTVAIISILLSVAIPAGFAISRNIRITNLDDTARQVFIAAQNSLTRLGSSGQSLLASDPEVPSMPSDFSGEEWNDGMYYYADVDSDNIETFLPFGSVEDAVRVDNHYVIEYSSESNTVYAVFFSNHEFDYLSVSAVDGFRSSRKVRKGYMVGYYGGNSVDRETVLRCRKPVIIIENTDILEATITGFEAGYSISVTISDGNTTVEVPDEYLVYNAYDGSYKLRMDSLLESEKQFKVLFPSLIPGADITLHVEFSKPDQLSSVADAKVNSLFAGRSGSEAAVTYTRHLQNLDPAFSKVTSGITSAKQLDNIQIPDGYRFVSILNPVLASYEGSQMEIRDYVSDGGLFKQANGMTLSNIRIVNPVVNSESGAVGVLANTASNTVVTGCGVYVDVKKDDGKPDYEKYPGYGLTGADNAGGLIGEATDCTLSTSFAALYYITVPTTGDAYSAGLIGKAKDCSITKCYSACDDLGGNGIFVGNSTGTTVDNCYAVGNRRANTPIPFARDAEVTNSYYVFTYFDTDGTRLGDPQYMIYDSEGTESTILQTALSNGVGLSGSFGSLVPTLSHPYNEELDGMAYLYPSILIKEGENIQHYGSWYVTGQLKVIVKVFVEGIEEETYIGGNVVIKNKDDTVLYSSLDEERRGEPFFVQPGAEIKVSEYPEWGYEYVEARIEGEVVDSLDITIRSDTVLCCYFRRTNYNLECLPVEYANEGLSGCNYDVTISGMSSILSPGTTTMVEENRTITVHVTKPDDLYVASVWYTMGDTDVPVNRDTDGNFAFTMPSADIKLHVKFTREAAKYNIRFLRREPSGEFVQMLTMNREYGIGEILGEDFFRMLAADSGLTLTVTDNGTTENVLYFLDGELKRGDETLYDISLDENGNVLEQGEAYTTQRSDIDAEFDITIRIERKRFNVTLVPGMNISRVGIGSPSTLSGSVTREVYYGERLLAIALVSGTNSFTAWVPDTTAFPGSPNTRYSFVMPSYDLTLTAEANDCFYVRANLFEDGESWLWSSESRQKQDVVVTLVNTSDPTDVYTLTNLTSDDKSYISESNNIPAMNEYGKGYYVYVNGEQYRPNGTPKVIQVRDKGVEFNIYFYSVTYYAGVQYYRGEVPESGTYLHSHVITIPGNTGYLRNDSEENEPIFAGWRSAYTATIAKSYTAGSTYTVDRKTDFFADWKAQSSYSLVYLPNDPVGSANIDGGSMPIDTKVYSFGQKVTPAAASLTRPGYDFIGWNTDKDATVALSQVTIGSGTTKLYAIWIPTTYNVYFHDQSGLLIADMTMTAGYGDVITLPDYNVSAFLGWSETQDGAIRYSAGSRAAIYKDIHYYAITGGSTVTLTYWADMGSGWEVIMTQTVCKGLPTYLYCKSKTDLTAWSVTKDGSGAFYVCDKLTGVSEDAVTFNMNANLYAIMDKVYDANKQKWFPNLGTAVAASTTANGDTLIVYRDTVETGEIIVNKDLYVISHGKNRLLWQGCIIPKTIYNGCLVVKDHKLTLGRSNILSMTEDDYLTFDADQLGRVIAIWGSSSADAVLTIYDGIELTNGRVDEGKGNDSSITNGDPDNNGGASAEATCRGHRGMFGGGVYVEEFGYFNMYGGKITYCTAISGGGVYLFKGAHMVMGNMEPAKYYSATAIYYNKIDEGYFLLPIVPVDISNFRDYYVTTGNPEISYCYATRGTNSASGAGGGAIRCLNLNSEELILYRGNICNNRTDSDGGGMVTDGKDNSDVLRIYEVSVSHNYAARNGGGEFQWTGTTFIYNSKFNQNYANNGAGLYLTDNSSKSEICNIQFYFGEIAYNTSGNAGGAVYSCGYGTIYVHGGTITGNYNKNSSNAGGIHIKANPAFRNKPPVENAQYLVISGGNIFNNRNTHTTQTHTVPIADIYLGRSQKAYTGVCISVPEGGLNLNYSELCFGAQMYVRFMDTADDNTGYPILVYDDKFDYKTEDLDKIVFVNNHNHMELGEYDGHTAFIAVYEAIAPITDREVVYDGNGGKFTVGGELKSFIYEDHKVGDVIRYDSLPSVSRPGYAQAGWALKADAYPEEYLTGNYTVTNKYTQRIYAIWRPYQLHYDINTSLENVYAPDTAVGPEVTILFPDITEITVDGVEYVFVGWSENKDAAEADEKYAEGEVVTLADDTIIYAIWAPKSTGAGE